MHSRSLRIFACLLAIAQIAAGAMQASMVLCQGENGHLALEIKHADEECGHGCEPVEETPEECDDDHSCVDTMVQDDAQRQVDDGSGKVPAPEVVAWLSFADPGNAATAVSAHLPPESAFTADPSTVSLRTVVILI